MDCSPPVSSVHGIDFPGKNWSGLPFPSPGDLCDLGIKPASPTLVGGFFTTELPGKPYVILLLQKKKRYRTTGEDGKSTGL